MTEALYTHSAYNIMYACRREKVQTVSTRMGFEIGSGAAYLSEMQIPVLEPGEAKEVMAATRDPVKYGERRKSLCEARRGKRIGENNTFFGKHHSPESIQKMSAAKKGKHLSEEHRHKISESCKNPSEEIRKKMSAAHKGKPLSEERRRHISEAKTGKPRGEDVCRKMSEVTKKLMENPEIRKKISESLKGRHLTEENKKKISESLKGKFSGERHPNWQGGISFEPYCVKFNKEFKERVRAFFGYKCIECQKPQNGAKLAIHHVNFNKKTCCDNSIPLFVPLCNSCHGKTGRNREYWQQHFTEIINRDYAGKCYFTKEEMVNFG